MDSSLTFVVIGCGSRGRTYTEIALKLGHRLVAVAEPAAAALAAIQAIAAPADLLSFGTGESLLDGEKLADLAIIATQDAQHFGHAAAALRLGYHVLLEKPAARSISEVEQLSQLAEQQQRKLILCFVLRYTPFFRSLKRALDAGSIGEIASIQALEGVGPWHQAHSFVRGHWSRSEKSTPMIVAKCSHDTDLLAWLAGAPCDSVSSHASCSYFRPEMAPHGATKRCSDACPQLGTCRFDAHRYLGEHRRWLAMVEPAAEEMDDDAILQWIKTSDWGRCVYHCDQDTPDHQVVGMKFANGITADLTMTAFDSGRRIRIYGSEGMLEGALHADGREAWIECRRHSGEITSVPIEEQDSDGYQGHGGGDFGLIQALPALISDQGSAGKNDFIEGHRIAFAAATAADQQAVVFLHSAATI